jgi:hypothetical protein
MIVDDYDDPYPLLLHYHSVLWNNAIVTSKRGNEVACATEDVVWIFLVIDMSPTTRVLQSMTWEPIMKTIQRNDDDMMYHRRPHHLTLALIK